MEAEQTSTKYGISRGRILWCQGMWCSSRENRSTKLQQHTSKNPGLCTTQLPCFKDRLQKPKSHNNDSQPLWKNQKRKNQKPVLANERTQIRSDSVPGLSVD